MPIPQLNQHKHNKSWKNQTNKPGLQEIKRTGSNHRNHGFSKRKKKKLSLKNLIFSKKFLGILIILFFLGVSTILGTFIWASQNLPDPNQLIQREVAQSTKIYDRTGDTLLYEIHGEQQRTLVTLEDIPDYMESATIAMEDKNFYEHQGFSLWAIFRTAITDIIYRKKAGGSTITQQLVKNAVLTPEKTFTRKIKELILAYRLEQKFSKNEILQLYLNEIPYGGTTYGVEAASRYYFGKNVKDISLAESAILAALPQAPSFYSPYGPNKELLLKRKDYILKLMNEQGYISETKMEEAQKEELEFRQPSSNIKAPHFVMYVKSLLSRKYGQKMLEQGGLKIYTTLDTYKQEIAEEVVEEGVKKNQEKYNAENAGLVSLDPKTGQILAMVGSRDYFDEKIDGKFNVTTAKRQPGSSMKPLVYSNLFTKGFTPQTKLFDVVTNFSNNPNQPYKPKNYDLEEHGPISIRKALAGSLNIPAVKALYLAGLDNVFEYLKNLGYSTFEDRSRFGLSLVLGGAEVKLIEHANAYSVFAREGVIHPLSVITKIEDSKGRVIEEHKKQEERIIEPKVARMINSVLSDNQARSFTYGLNNWLTLDSRPVAAKTGTTNDYRDAWTVGYTPSLVAGVWVGNNDNQKMVRGASGGNAAAPIWNHYMSRVLGDTPVETFKKPVDIKTGKPAIDGELDFKQTVKIDTVSGLLATEHTPEKYIKEVEYQADPHCILYYINKEDPLGEAPEDPSQDPQFNSWEKAVQNWARENEFSSTSSIEIPTKYDDVHRPEFKPLLNIKEPNNKEIITSKNLVVKIKTSAPRGINRVNYYLNNNYFTSSKSYPFSLDRNIDFLNSGYHDLGVESCDGVGNCTRKNLIFNYKNNSNKKDAVPSVSWIKPQKNLSLTSVDFPFTFKLNISNNFKVAQVEFISELTSTSSEIDSIYKTRGGQGTMEFNWNKPNVGGTYKITPKLFTWDGKETLEKEIYVTINNN